MTYDEAIDKLREWSEQIVTKPDNEMAQVLRAIEANHNLMLRWYVDKITRKEGFSDE